MMRKCNVCGKEVNENLMEQIGYGRNKEYWCWECYLNSQREAAASDMYRQKRLHKMRNSKKRNR